MKHILISITMMGTAFVANGQSCPDNNHPHAIDLGLPSGTKWACCNVGAATPEDSGDYYAWGETEKKEIYDWTTYVHCDGSMETCHDLGSDIAGTEYDVAHVQWGASWVMPSQDQFKELCNNCSYTWTIMNGVSGNLFTGPSGSTIFLPEADFWRRHDEPDEETDELPSAGYYWASMQRVSNSSHASSLLFSSGHTYWDSYNYRCLGLTVRPVISRTSIIILSKSSTDDDTHAVYNVRGIKVASSPAHMKTLLPGIYIRQGRKVVK